MSETIKLADTEVSEVRALQEKFQQTAFQLGQNTLSKIQAESALKQTAEQENKLAETWTSLQKEENTLIDKFLKKYGEGSLDLNAGTFIVEKKPVPA